MFLYLLMTIIILVVKREQIPIIPKRLIIAYMSFLVVMIWSLLWTPDLQYGLLKSLEFVFLTSLACFAPFFLFREEKVFNRFIMTLVVISAFLSVFVFIAKPYSFLEADIEAVKFDTVLGGNYILMQYVTGMASLGIIYHLFYKENSRIVRTIYFVLTLIFLATLMYSSGKSSIISFFLTVLFMFFMSVKRNGAVLSFKRKYFRIGFIVLLVGAVFMMSIGWVFVTRTKALSTPDYYGRVERLSNAKIALDLFLENPLRGVGIGGFNMYSIQMEDIEKFKYPHNILLEVMSELGMVGLALFLFILGSALKNLLYLKRKYWHSHFDTLPNVVISFLLFTFLMAMTSGNITNLALFALMGMAYSVENLIKKESREIECVSG